MKPAWPVIFLTTLAGAGQGLFLAVFAVDLLRAGSANTLVIASCGLSLLLLASHFALGRREGVLFAFMGAVLAYGALHFLEDVRPWLIAAGIAAAILCIALFACTGRIYAVSRYATLNFLLWGAASGLTLSVPVAVLALPQFGGVLSLAAVAFGLIAYVLSCASLARHVGPRTARWIFLVLGFPVPGYLLGWGGGSLPVCVAAFAIQFAGLIAERRIFLAGDRQRDRLSAE